jgi:hypothetical protein
MAAASEAQQQLREAVAELEAQAAERAAQLEENQLAMAEVQVRGCRCWFYVCEECLGLPNEGGQRTLSCACILAACAERTNALLLSLHSTS